MRSVRRSDFDVTNTVQVSSPEAVLAAIRTLFQPTWPALSLKPLEDAFQHFERLFAGDVPGYMGVDTVYHDRQHTLDITLALARLLVGYERQHDEKSRLGGDRALLGLLTGLFHDVGYLRRLDDREIHNGAEFTRNHVSRGARFLEEYLPVIGLAHAVPVATEIIHFTGYEVPFARIKVTDPRDIKAGHLLGTADMIAQMADRCYLEKCRDRLYAEFVLGGVALPMAANGGREVKYASGLDLLRQTPEFVAEVRAKRLDGEFHAAYKNLEILYNGRNPYMEAIDRNVDYLRQILRSENWRLLRRNPPIFAASADPMSTMRGLMLGYIKRVWASKHDVR
ncbi:MAG TPA: HD domain-containing protein [Steroidobacteraceae bacterium]|nr:HD domain-containing protein [Steroidobacteraceae bacterium]